MLYNIINKFYILGPIPYFYREEIMKVESKRITISECKNTICTFILGYRSVISQNFVQMSPINLLILPASCNYHMFRRPSC